MVSLGAAGDWGEAEAGLPASGPSFDRMARAQTFPALPSNKGPYPILTPSKNTAMQPPVTTTKTALPKGRPKGNTGNEECRKV